MKETTEGKASSSSLSNNNPPDTGPTAPSTTEPHQQPPMQNLSPVRTQPNEAQVLPSRKERKLATGRQGANSDRKSTRLNSSHLGISYAVFCLNGPGPTEIYTLSLHDALPISVRTQPNEAQVLPSRKERKLATGRQGANSTAATDSGEVHLFLCHRLPARGCFKFR